MFEPFRPIRRKPGESEAAFRSAVQARRELNASMRVSYLEGLVEALSNRIGWLERDKRELYERVARLEASL